MEDKNTIQLHEYGLSESNTSDSITLGDKDENSNSNILKVPKFTFRDVFRPAAPSYRESHRSGTTTPDCSSAQASPLPQSFGLQLPEYAYPGNWLPHTLRWPYLSFLLAVSIILGVVLAISTDGPGYLFGYYGYPYPAQGPDPTKSRWFEFEWRFLPTTIAVIYGLLWEQIYIDVRRTQPYANMALPFGAPAESTLLLEASHWWKDPFIALSKHRNHGRRNWLMFWVAVAKMIALFVIAPLSSGLLTFNNDVETMQSYGIRYEIDYQNGTINFEPDDESYFKTIAHFSYGLSTSAWITENFFAFPAWVYYWSYGYADSAYPFEYLPTSDLASADVAWNTSTTKLHVVTTCVPLTCVGSSLEESQLMLSVTSTTGCSMNLSIGADTSSLDAVGIWGKIGSPTLAADNTAVISNASEICLSQELLFYARVYSVFVNGSLEGNALMTEDSVLEICSTQYSRVFEAVVVKVSPNSSAFVVEDYPPPHTVSNISASLPNMQYVDNVYVVGNYSKLDNSTFNLDAFENAFWSDEWDDKSPPAADVLTRGPVGVLTQLLRSGGFDRTEFVAKAGALKQYFFGQLVYETLDRQLRSSPRSESYYPFLPDQTTNFYQTWEYVPLPKNGVGSYDYPTPAIMRSNAERLYAFYNISTIISSLVILEAFICCLVLFYSRPKRRPLNLIRDPGPVTSTVAMVLGQDELCQLFEGLDRASGPGIHRAISHLRFRIYSGKISVIVDSIANEECGSPNPGLKKPRLLQERSKSFMVHIGRVQARLWKDWRPATVRRLGISALLLFLLGHAASLLILYILSRTTTQIRNVGGYELSESFLPNIAFYSVVPTFLAILVKMWWTSLEEIYRRLTPFSFMVKQPTLPSDGIKLFFGSSPPVWICIRALFKKQWLLSLIALGTAFGEVYTVGVSAIWHYEVKYAPRSGSGYYNDQIRDGPYRFANLSEIGAKESILSSLNGDYLSSWLYSSVLQNAFNTSSQPWIKDEWTFSHIDYFDPSNWTNSMYSVKPGSSYTITDADALGGFLTCEPAIFTPDYTAGYPADDDSWKQWAVQWDVSDRTRWTADNSTPYFATGWELRDNPASLPNNSTENRPGLQLKNGYSTSFFARPSRVTCCSNSSALDSNSSQTSHQSNAVLAYWSPIYSNLSSSIELETNNFTVKWIVGNPISMNYTAGNGTKTTSHLIWQQYPRIAALNCQPIIRKAKATVKVDPRTYRVLDYTIHDGSMREDDSAWTYSLDNFGVTHTGENNNITNIFVSLGNLFRSALLSAAYSNEVNITNAYMSDENTADREFNFRKTSGVNVDFMSYAMYQMANKSLDALLDLNLLANYASKVFSTAFTHFANAPTRDCLEIGWGYQSLWNDTNSDDWDVGYCFESPTQRIDFIFNEPVQVLVVSEIAALLCWGILGYMVLVSLAILANGKMFTGLPRDVETIASVIAFVYKSPKLMEKVKEEDRIFRKKWEKSQARQMRRKRWWSRHWGRFRLWFKGLFYCFWPKKDKIVKPKIVRPESEQVTFKGKTSAALHKTIVWLYKPDAYCRERAKRRGAPYWPDQWYTDRQAATLRIKIGTIELLRSLKMRVLMATGRRIRYDSDERYGIGEFSEGENGRERYGIEVEPVIRERSTSKT